MLAGVVSASRSILALVVLVSLVASAAPVSHWLEVSVHPSLCLGLAVLV